MGKGSAILKSYTTAKGYYRLKDYDKRFGGDFIFLIEPLVGWNNERFFYVRELGGYFEITGEGYVIAPVEKAAAQVKNLETELRGSVIYYCFIDEYGHVIRKEKGSQI